MHDGVHLATQFTRFESFNTGFGTERGRPLERKRPRQSRSTAPSRRSTEESLTAELAQDG